MPNRGLGASHRPGRTSQYASARVNAKSANRFRRTGRSPRGSKEKNKHSNKKRRAGRGTVGKIIVTGAKDRESNQISAAVISSIKRTDLRQFTHERIDVDAVVFTDDLKSYDGLRSHVVVRHGVGEYVSDQAHINGME